MWGFFASACVHLRALLRALSRTYAHNAHITCKVRHNTLVVVKHTYSKTLEYVMTSKKKLDWDKIERDYRADVLSIAQIARESGAPSSTIRARAKRNGWKRDLSSRIKMKADEFVNQDAIKNAIAGMQDAEEQTIEENARLTAAVRLNHRKDITRARLATMTLLGDLEAMIGADGQASLGQLLTAIVDDGYIQDGDHQAIDAYKRATGLSQQVANMQKLADTMTKLVSLERQAWNLDSLDDKTHDPLEALLFGIANSNNNAFAVVADDPEYGPAGTNSIGVNEDE